MSKPNSIINISLTVDWSLEIVRHAGQKYVLVLYLEFLFLSLLNLRDVNEQEYLHLWVLELNFFHQTTYLTLAK